MSYINAIDYLYNLQKYGIKLGIEKTQKIMSVIGNPHNDFRTIHVAGTNGKGSVSAIIASILMANGFKVGLFTSPHLVSFTERIRINNKEISESDVVNLTKEIKTRLEYLKSQIPDPTFFEFVTAMAFLYFSRNAVDWAVIEAGMGGRLDATNIIIPEVSVITKISYDHKEFLGDTLTAIAKEKAGIIKNRVPVVSAQQDKEAEEVIIKTAIEKSSPLFIYGKDFSGKLRSSGLEGITFDYIDNSYTIANLHTPLAGDHQLFNACIAIKAAMIAIRKKRPESQVFNEINEKTDYLFEPLNSQILETLLKDGISKTKWHGRLEIVNYDPIIMIDGAHNPDAASVLAEFIRSHLINYRIILIMGVMSDKDIKGIMSPLLPVASEIIFTAPNYSRAASPQRLSEIALQMGFPSKTANSVKEAIEMAMKDYNAPCIMSNEFKSPLITHHSSLILITGSFYTIGEAMEILGKTSVLGTLRETV